MVYRRTVLISLGLCPFNGYVNGKCASVRMSKMGRIPWTVGSVESVLWNFALERDMALGRAS